MEVVELKGRFTLHECSLGLTQDLDTVTDFSWEPKGERFAIVSSSDPNLGNPGPGITIKTDISFYQLDRTKNDFRLLRTLDRTGVCLASLMHYTRYARIPYEQHHSVVTAGTTRGPCHCRLIYQV